MSTVNAIDDINPIVNEYTVSDMLELCEIRNEFDQESSLICDPSGVIEFFERNELENLFDVFKFTRFNVVVVSGIADMGITFSQSQVDQVVHRFALDLFNGLNIVKDSKRYDRALIFVSREQQSAAIICDTDMLTKISPEGLEKVTRDTIALVKRGEINIAIEDTIRKLNLIATMDGNVGSEENLEGHLKKARRQKAWKIAPRFFIGLFVLFLLYAMFERNVDNQLVKGKVTLGHVLDELTRSVQPSSLKLRRASCPTCLDRFTELDGSCKGLDVPLDYTEENVDTTEEKVVESDNVDDVFSSSRRIDVNNNHGCLLACGHEFCQACLHMHLLPKNGMMCPICLNPIELPSEYRSEEDEDVKDNDDDNEGSALLGSVHSGSDFTEVLYRLDRIRYLYPRVLSDQKLRECKEAFKENDLTIVRDIIQARFDEIKSSLTSRENLLKNSVLGDRFSHASSNR